jgi:hypothetical protein
MKGGVRMDNEIQKSEVVTLDSFDEIEEIVTPMVWGTIGCCNGVVL